MAFEICSSKGHPSKGCHQLADLHKKYKANCYLVYPEAKMALPTAKEPGKLPLDLFLILAGQQANLAMQQGISSTRGDGPDLQLSLFDELR